MEVTSLPKRKLLETSADYLHRWGEKYWYRYSASIAESHVVDLAIGQLNEIHIKARCFSILNKTLGIGSFILLIISLCAPLFSLFSSGMFVVNGSAQSTLFVLGGVLASLYVDYKRKQRLSENVMRNLLFGNGELAGRIHLAALLMGEIDTGMPTNSFGASGSLSKPTHSLDDINPSSIK
ncbi:MAG: hypothetical protein IT440_12905 [Phycisphaeraceae bacterium]|nr:hypothetical protein [Phycisphaeraceae bacterium]